MEGLVKIGTTSAKTYWQYGDQILLIDGDITHSGHLYTTEIGDTSSYSSTNNSLYASNDTIIMDFEMGDISLMFMPGDSIVSTGGSGIIKTIEYRDNTDITGPSNPGYNSFSALIITEAAHGVTSDFRGTSWTIYHFPRVNLRGTINIQDVLRCIPRSDSPSPAELGMIYLDSDDNELYYYNGTAWEKISP
jgi:hypothetical protein